MYFQTTWPPQASDPLRLSKAASLEIHLYSSEVKLQKKFMAVASLDVSKNAAAQAGVVEVNGKKWTGEEVAGVCCFL